MNEKKKYEALAHPDPGRNCRRHFSNATYDVNPSPVDFAKYSDRVPFYEQVPRLDGPHE